MATKQAKRGNGSLKALVKTRLGEAQKGLQTLEQGTQRAIEGLQSRAVASGRELGGLWTSVEREVSSGKGLKKLTRQLERASTVAGKSLETLRTQLVEGAGLASQRQVAELHRELGRLGKKVEAALGQTQRPSRASAAPRAE